MSGFRILISHSLENEYCQCNVIKKLLFLSKKGKSRTRKLHWQKNLHFFNNFEFFVAKVSRKKTILEVSALQFFIDSFKTKSLLKWQNWRKILFENNTLSVNNKIMHPF
jgi:hypothetical protein